SVAPSLNDSTFHRAWACHVAPKTRSRLPRLLAARAAARMPLRAQGNPYATGRPRVLGKGRRGRARARHSLFKPFLFACPIPYPKHSDGADFPDTVCHAT